MNYRRPSGAPGGALLRRAGLHSLRPCPPPCTHCACSFPVLLSLIFAVRQHLFTYSTSSVADCGAHTLFDTSHSVSLRALQPVCSSALVVFIAHGSRTAAVRSSERRALFHVGRGRKTSRSGVEVHRMFIHARRRARRATFGPFIPVSFSLIACCCLLVPHL
jgi:hypothetical protein